jgi:DNA-binding PadR family transcriptional regulator
MKHIRPASDLFSTACWDKPMSVRYAILGLLHYRNMHGYEIKRHIEQHFGHMWTINFGQIYPNLKSLEEDALIALSDVSPSERGGPHKKLYAITPTGRETFARWLKNDEESRMFLRDPFLMRFIFFGFGDRGQAVAIIDKQIAQYEEQCLRRERHVARWKQRGTYVRLVAELGVEFNRMYVEWLKRARQEILDGRGEEALAAGEDLALPEDQEDREK